MEDLRKRVSSVYVKARKENIPVDPETQVYPIFEEALAETPWNVQVWTEYITTMERNKCEVSKIVLVFEKALTISFDNGQDFRDIWLVYLDCLRRHTDWNDEKQVSSLDKTFDVCTRYLGQIPESDPELKILKYWALIQAKHMDNMKAARELWEGIADKQGLKHSRSCKFWTQYAEFERLYGAGDDQTYRNLLHRALQQTHDYPEVIAERLITFERQEGESIDTLVDAESRCNRILAKAEKLRREREAALAEERSKRQSTNEGQTNNSKRKRKKSKLPNDNESSNSSGQKDDTLDELNEKKSTPSTGTNIGSQEPGPSRAPAEGPKKVLAPMLPRSVAIKKKT